MRLLSLFALITIITFCAYAQELPREWIDPDTGHRVIRLSDEPGSASLYFHHNAYTPDGEKLIITTPTGLSTINLKTRVIEKVVDGRVNVIITGKKTGDIYYTKAGVVYATNLKTKATREVAKLPPRASVASVNADETLLAGIIDEGPPPPVQTPGAAPRGDNYPGKGDMMERRLAERRPLRLITVNTSNGEVKTLLKGTDWYNHIQFSPTDPTLLMFCH